jgi:hypothetical protein
MASRPDQGKPQLPWEMSITDWAKALNTVESEKLCEIWATLAHMIAIRYGIQTSQVLATLKGKGIEMADTDSQREKLVLLGVHGDPRFVSMTDGHSPS